MSPSVQTAFGWARAATPANKPVDSTALLLGVVRAHSGRSEPEILMAHLGRPLAEFYVALKAVSPELDIDVKDMSPLSELPDVASESEAVFRAALKLVAAYDVYKDQRLHMPHLFGGMLRSGPDADAHRVLQRLLGHAKARASEEYVEFMGELAARRSTTYADFLLKHPLVAVASLPAPPEPFVGRERELEEIRMALREGMSVFITGPAGIGKTALALRSAANAVGGFPGGIAYVSGLTPDASAAAQAALVRTNDQKALLILDNADGIEVEGLVNPQAGPAIVVTRSRMRGGSHGKSIRLGPLRVEDVRKLLEARASQRLTEAELAEFVSLIGGRPVAVSFVVTLLSTGLPAQQLLRETWTLLAETTAGEELVALKERHSAAWRELEPRYKHCQPHEQRLFRVIGLLKVPFSAEQAALAAGGDAQGAEVMLADLAATGLVEEREDGRWSLSEATGAFARSLLADEPELERNLVILQALSARHGIGLTAQEPTALAGFHSDEPSAVDHIGFEADVEALSSVLIAEKVIPPISVGLFGEWGTGKSTFMRLMRDQIRVFQKEWADRDDSPFCSSVKQITFNAWNYSDANLWASLVTKIFDGLAAPDPEVAGDVALGAEERKAIVNALETAKATVAQKEAERYEAEKRGEELEGRLARIRKQEEKTGEQLEKIRPAQVLEQARNSDKVKSLGDEVLQHAGKEGDVDDAVAVALELRSTWGFISCTARLLGRKRVVAIVLITLVLVAVVAVAESVGVPVAATLAAAVGWVASVARLARVPVELARKAAEAGDQLLTGLHEEEQAAIRRKEAEVHRELTQLAAQAAQIDSELQKARSAAARAEREIDDIQSGRRITQFVEERSASAEYTQYLGLIALIRRDFDELARLWLDRQSGDKAPFDRIILYIDDLDRCRAELVVQVLEAVHLLLALKLFVVVVGVDPRWLSQSLKKHYIGQLGLRNGDEPDDEDEDWSTTPQNYLEKIFQIPFALRPMGDGYKRMVNSLFELRAVEGAHGTAPEGPDDEIEATGHANTKAAVDEHHPSVASHPPVRRPERTLELLRIWPAELEFISRLGALVPTPRAANRLANTYRLIRVKEDRDSLARFVSSEGKAGDYRVALVLLAVVVGFPDLVDYVFRRLLEGRHENFWAFVDGLNPPPDSSPHQTEAYPRLLEALRGLRRDSGLPEDIAPYREWVPRVSRYSFETVRIPWKDPRAPLAQRERPADSREDHQDAGAPAQS
jgi:KAP family P-loop domain